MPPAALRQLQAWNAPTLVRDAYSTYSGAVEGWCELLIW